MVIILKPITWNPLFLDFLEFGPLILTLTTQLHLDLLELSCVFEFYLTYGLSYSALKRYVEDTPFDAVWVLCVLHSCQGYGTR